jgi:hypothetical protein
MKKSTSIFLKELLCFYAFSNGVSLVQFSVFQEPQRCIALLLCQRFHQSDSAYGEFGPLVWPRLKHQIARRCMVVLYCTALYRVM